MFIIFNKNDVFFLFSDFLTCRQVLNIMVILGFMLNYALRVNLTIAIVAMVHNASDKHVTNHTLDNSTNLEHLTTHIYDVNHTSNTLEHTIGNSTDDKVNI